jgi:Neocarzinostatin family
MKKLRAAMLVLAVSLAVPLVWATPAFAQRSLAVTPSTGLVDLDSVTIAGTGFNPSVEVGFCQGIDDGSPSPSDCGSSIGFVNTTPAGDFSAQQTVRRFMHVPSLGRTVDCASEACAIAAAEVSDITGTAILVPIAFAPAPPPPATRGSITVTPENPVDGQELTVAGTGFRPNAKVEILECVTDPADPTDCSPNFATTVTDTAGAFSAPYIVRQFFSPPGGSTVDCNPPGVCVVAAAEVVDIPGTIVTAPFQITALQPDGMIRRRSDGAITGNDIYNLDGSGQTRIRAVAPGTKWSFAVQFENDGDVADDITVTAPPSSPPFTVRYFVAYFDITAQVTGGGFTLTDLAPGQPVGLAVQFNVAPDAPLESRADPLVTFTSATAPRADAVRVGVVVRAVIAQSGSD